MNISHEETIKRELNAIVATAKYFKIREKFNTDIQSGKRLSGRRYYNQGQASMEMAAGKQPHSLFVS
ncbi:MAG: hypothetical protein JRD93_12750 [Deltaproteobacteria bacterium]|nr:hypothetical protein [Deltaproteobacteria bacterium]MBW2662827.1 hypothetical protein [Deltaproteobacteria bacterium]